MADVGQERRLRSVQRREGLEPGLLPRTLGGDGEDLPDLVGDQGREPFVVLVEGPQGVRAQHQHCSGVVLHPDRQEHVQLRSALDHPGPAGPRT